MKSVAAVQSDGSLSIPTSEDPVAPLSGLCLKISSAGSAQAWKPALDLTSDKDAFPPGRIPDWKVISKLV